ncbi:MAG: hypothetical protein WKF81_07290, partial [Thermomicrobiales bacterium]
MSNDSRTSTYPSFDRSGSDRADGSASTGSNQRTELDEDLNLEDEEFREQEAEVATKSLGRRLLEPRTILSFLIAAVVLYFVVERSNINPREVWATLQTA